MTTSDLDFQAALDEMPDPKTFESEGTSHEYLRDHSETIHHALQMAMQANSDINSRKELFKKLKNNYVEDRPTLIGTDEFAMLRKVLIPAAPTGEVK